MSIIIWNPGFSRTALIVDDSQEVEVPDIPVKKSLLCKIAHKLPGPLYYYKEDQGLFEICRRCGERIWYYAHNAPAKNTVLAKKEMKNVHTITMSDSLGQHFHMGELITMSGINRYGHVVPPGGYRVLSVDSDCQITVRPVRWYERWWIQICHTWRSVMKKLMVIAVFGLFAQAAQADTLLRFRDGSANVWDNIYEKPGQLCTRKASNMEICADARDVVVRKEVPAGTDPLEEGGASSASLAELQEDYSLRDTGSDQADKSKVARRDAEIDQRVKSAAQAEQQSEKARKRRWQKQSDSIKY